MKQLIDILHEDDSLTIEQANLIADAIDGPDQSHLLQYLQDIIERTGTGTESRLAAILRGMILAMNSEQSRNSP